MHDDGAPRGDAPGGAADTTEFSKAPITPDTSDEEARRWHRLHPLTPILRGGWFVIAVFGWLISQQWNRIVSLVLPDEYTYEDPTSTFLNEPGRLMLVLVGTIVIGLVIIGLSYLSWRAHRYRITDELFEAREGIITKKHRQARLDRVQSIDINRPFYARIFGAAAVVIDTASSDGNISLKFVRSAHAEPLREAILRRASGAKRRSVPQPSSAGAPSSPGDPAGTGAAGSPWPGATVPGQDWGGASDAGEGAAPGQRPGTGAVGGDSGEGRLAALIRARVDEITDFQRETRDAAPQSIVKIPVGRLFGAAAIDLAIVAIGFGIVGAVMLAIMLIIAIVNPEGTLEVGVAVGITLVTIVVPFVAVAFAVMAGRLMSNFNYSIVGTTDGVRVAKGFPSTTSETVPPGRIHAIEVRQPMTWRPFGWWEIRITRAGQAVDASSGSTNAQKKAVLLPVGTIDDVRRVLDLISPLQSGPRRAQVIEQGLTGMPGDEFVPGPPRSRWLHPISFRRIGYVLDHETFYIRRGRIGRKLTITPGERMQSIAAIQGPVLRLFGLANVQAQTVAGVVNTMLPTMDARDAVALFDRLRVTAVSAARKDSSHRWREASAHAAVATARIRAEQARARGDEPARHDVAVLQALADFEASDGGPVPQAQPPQGYPQQAQQPQGYLPPQPQQGYPQQPQQPQGYPQQPQPQQPLPPQRENGDWQYPPHPRNPHEGPRE
ncbi:PH domain-containing protein [Pseudoclavibacter endophyticus]|uniref:PH domain-containing protein n=1 Tax=Pseudoclavibacter endophyticus TaxID=1778590 RepID=A0A6H9WQF5_9MICO|nr:PH domain-containing protein [Pseudoclavibacter endophyticus]KAB1648275.1 PH domain-containing protein [Pseudoclavibacter endophyticus]